MIGATVGLCVRAILSGTNPAGRHLAGDLTLDPTASERSSRATLNVLQPARHQPAKARPPSRVKAIETAPVRVMAIADYFRCDHPAIEDYLLFSAEEQNIRRPATGI